MDSEQENSEFVPEYLSRLEENVLSELSLREKNYSFRFNGLRRLLKDVHQQKLSRALERLQEDQLIERYPDGSYGLQRNSYESIRDYYNKHQIYLDSNDLNYNDKTTFSAVSHNHSFPVKALKDHLSGKYFGNFRFIGHYYSNGQGRLEWIHAEDHSKIIISSITASKIEIVTYNVSSKAINKFIQIVQEILFDYQIITEFAEQRSQAN